MTSYRFGIKPLPEKARMIVGLKSLFRLKPAAGVVDFIFYAPVHFCVFFFNRTEGVEGALKWTFGDGSSSTLKNPIHTFMADGNYTVTLTIGEQSTTKHIIISGGVAVEDTAGYVAETFIEFKSKFYSCGHGGVMRSDGTGGWESVLEYPTWIRNMAVHNGKIYAGGRPYGGGVEVLFESSDGENWTELPKIPSGEQVTDILSLASYNGKLYVGTNRNLYSWDGADYTREWSFVSGYYVWALIPFGEEILYVNHYGQWYQWDGANMTQDTILSPGEIAILDGKIYQDDGMGNISVVNFETEQLDPVASAYLENNYNFEEFGYSAFFKSAGGQLYLIIFVFDEDWDKIIFNALYQLIEGQLVAVYISDVEDGYMFMISVGAFNGKIYLAKTADYATGTIISLTK